MTPYRSHSDPAVVSQSKGWRRRITSSVRNISLLTHFLHQSFFFNFYKFFSKFTYNFLNVFSKLFNNFFKKFLSLPLALLYVCLLSVLIIFILNFQEYFLKILFQILLKISWKLPQKFSKICWTFFKIFANLLKYLSTVGCFSKTLIYILEMVFGCNIASITRVKYSNIVCK